MAYEGPTLYQSVPLWGFFSQEATDETMMGVCGPSTRYDKTTKLCHALNDFPCHMQQTCEDPYLQDVCQVNTMYSAGENEYCIRVSTT